MDNVPSEWMRQTMDRLKAMSPEDLLGAAILDANAVRLQKEKRQELEHELLLMTEMRDELQRQLDDLREKHEKLKVEILDGTLDKKLKQAASAVHHIGMATPDRVLRDVAFRAEKTLLGLRESVYG